MVGHRASAHRGCHVGFGGQVGLQAAQRPVEPGLDGAARPAERGRRLRLVEVEQVAAGHHLAVGPERRPAPARGRLTILGEHASAGSSGLARSSR